MEMLLRKLIFLISVVSLLLILAITESIEYGFINGTVQHQSETSRIIRGEGKTGEGKPLVVPLDQIDADDLLLVGGKGANLGELLKIPGLNIPEGFVVTTDALKLFFESNPGLRHEITDLLSHINWDDPGSINSTSELIKQKILQASMPQEIVEIIKEQYSKLEEVAGVSDVPVAVRSSGVSEDAPDASWAGQFRTELNRRGIFQVIEAIQELWSELFNPDVLTYGRQHDIEFEKFSMGIIVQRMINASEGHSGVAFGLDPDSGFRAAPGIVDGVYYIEALPGLGEALVQNLAEPDGFLVVKKLNGEFEIIETTVGAKEKMIVYKPGLSGTEIIDTPQDLRTTWALTEERVLEIAKIIDSINQHYDRPQDVEFAIEADTIYIVQSRAETKHSLKPIDLIEWSKMVVKQSDIDAFGAEPILKGTGVGLKGAGVGRVVMIDHNSPIPVREQAARVKEGDVLVAYRTDPSIVDAMRRAGLIVTEIGGMNSHAAIVAREYDLNAIIGAEGAMSILAEGQIITLDSERGVVFPEELPLTLSETHYRISELPVTKKIKIGTLAFDTDRVRAMFPMSLYDMYYGIGLMRLEFVLGKIGIHPLAILAYDAGETLAPEVANEIEKRIKQYPTARDFFITKVKEGIINNATVLRDGQKVIVRTTDYKTNEYEDQLGGEFEELLVTEVMGRYPESDPMRGFRGIERMLNEKFAEAFDMELEAILSAWAEAPDKVSIMIPVVRTPEDVTNFKEVLRKKIDEMGLSHLGEPELIMMFEVPSNIFQVNDFIAAGVDGFSFGTNDLTQFILAVDRDSGFFKGEALGEYDAVSKAVIKALGIAIKAAKEAGISTGICGQAPSDHPDIYPAILTALGIDSISVTHDVFHKVVERVANAELEGGGEMYLRDLTLFLDYIDNPTPEEVKYNILDSDSILKNNIKIHPLALLAFDRRQISDRAVVNRILKKIGDKTGQRYFWDIVYKRVKEALESGRKEYVYRTSNFLSSDYAKLTGGNLFESAEANPTMGVFGMYRMLHYQNMLDMFRLELTAVLEAARDTGKKIKIEFDMVRTVKELNDAVSLLEEVMEDVGLSDEYVEIGMRIATPANVLLIDKFIEGGNLNFVSIDRDVLASNILAATPLSLVPADRIERVLEIPMKIILSAIERHPGVRLLIP